MPEAPVYKDASAIFAQYDVRCARQSLHIDAEPVPMSKEELPHQHLRPCIPALDACHALVALFGS